MDNLGQHSGSHSRLPTEQGCGFHGRLAFKLCNACSKLPLAKPRRSHPEAGGSRQSLVAFLFPVKPTPIVADRVDNQRHIERPVEEMVADEAVHAREKHTPVRMRMIPADHLQVIAEFVPLAADLSPRIVREFEMASGALVVFRSQAVTDHHERPAVLVEILPSQHDAAQLHAGIGLGVRFHVPQHVHVDEDRQVALGRGAVVDHGEMPIAVGPTPALGRHFLDFAELDILVGHEIGWSDPGYDTSYSDGNGSPDVG